MSSITCPSPNFTQAFNLWALALAPLPRCFIKFLWEWLLSLILTGGQRRKANKRNQWWGRQSLRSSPSIPCAASSFFLLHVPHCLVLTRALWLSLGPMTPCGRWEDHNRDQGRTWRRAVPSRKTDSEGERRKLWARRCLKEAAGICSDGLCSLELLLKLDGGSSQKEEKSREVNPRPSTCSPTLPHYILRWVFNNLLWETSVTGEVVTSLTYPGDIHHVFCLQISRRCFSHASWACL